MIKRIFQSFLKTTFPNRYDDSMKIDPESVAAKSGCLQNLTFSLQGTYSYEEVNKLNKLTKCFARYGYCPNKGPVAIIGISNKNANWGYFQEVSVYGGINSFKEFSFQKYTDDTAKQIPNYTVYGISGLEKIANYVKFNKINLIHDSRFKDICTHEYRILRMKCKLKGQFTFKEAETIAKHQHCFSVDRSMAYATLDNNKHVAIMSFWYEQRDEVAGFRDVWESDRPEPPTQGITFMTDKEAQEIDDFSIYLYDYRLFNDFQKLPNISKIDRTLVPDFDFYDTPDGKDLRLSEQF